MVILSFSAVIKCKIFSSSPTRVDCLNCYQVENIPTLQAILDPPTLEVGPINWPLYVCPSVWWYLAFSPKRLLPILDPGLTEGIPCNHTSPSVGWSIRLLFCPSLDISETFISFFIIFCMKLGHHKGTKVTEPDFWKKILWGHKWEKKHFEGIFDIFCPYLCIPSLKCFEISYPW